MTFPTHLPPIGVGWPGQPYPGSFNGKFQMARRYLRLGRVADARRMAERAVDTVPEYGDLDRINFVLWVRDVLEDPDCALELIVRWMRPDDPDIWLAFASMYVGTSPCPDRQRLIEDLERLDAELEPGEPDEWLVLACLAEGYALAGEHKMASELITKAVLAAEDAHAIDDVLERAQQLPLSG